MSFYSDLDVSVIDEMPVEENHYYSSQKGKRQVYVYNFCKDEIKKEDRFILYIP
jgi:ATP-dependent DNA helicase RecG